MRRLLDRAASRTAGAAALVDALCLGGFVLLGRESHGVDGGPTWFLVVVWPFVAAWFAVALVTRLYTARSHRLERLAVTVAVGVAAALVLRAVVTQRPTPVAFIVVACLFIAALTVGWRCVAGLALPGIDRRTG